MLTFITTLRHPHNSTNYRCVESLLQNTLSSLAQQSSDDYVAIVVGNRRPSFPMPERAVFVEVDFPPPSDVNGPRTGRAPVIWDKGTKIAIGLVAARAHRPDYVMAVDADDFVHRDVTAYVHAHGGHDGWVVKRGWGVLACQKRVSAAQEVLPRVRHVIHHSVRSIRRSNQPDRVGNAARDRRGLR